MKILMLTPYLPYPPASGGQIRTLNLLKYLSKNNQITLIALYKNEKEKKYASYLESYCKDIYLCKRAEKPWQPGNILKSIFSFLPFLIVRNYSVEARKTVAKLLETEHFDVIHAETFYIMPHIPHTDVPILLVEQTIEFKVYQHFISSLPYFMRLAFYLDILKLRSSELYYWNKATAVATVSDFDQEMIEKLVPHLEPKPTVIPNGAGDEMFVEDLKEKKFDKPKLLFIGNFSWLQNTEAALFLLEKIYPLLIDKLPNVEIIVAGQNANKRLSEYKSPNITITDIAPDDISTVRDLYRETTLFIAPVFGPGGTNLKILAAMASGLPVVSTKIGAERLKMTDTVHALTANKPEEFVDKIVSILSDEKLYNEIRKNAYELAQKKYSWNAISQQLEVVYRSIRKNHANRN